MSFECQCVSHRQVRCLEQSVCTCVCVYVSLVSVGVCVYTEPIETGRNVPGCHLAAAFLCTSCGIARPHGTQETAIVQRLSITPGARRRERASGTTSPLPGSVTATTLQWGTPRSSGRLLRKLPGTCCLRQSSENLRIAQTCRDARCFCKDTACSSS